MRLSNNYSMKKIYVEACPIAKISFWIGAITFASWLLAVLLGLTFPAPPGHASPALGKAGALFVILMLLSILLSIGTLIITVTTLILVIVSKGERKGIVLAMTGLALAGIPWLYGPVTRLINF